MAMQFTLLKNSVLQGVLLVVVFQINGCFPQTIQTVELTIPDGTIEGIINQTVGNDVTYYSFRGIPFAQPPVGALRFASPQPNSPWNGTLDATSDKSECVQLGGGDYLATGDLYGSEDCLYINVYTPNITAPDLPVLVWIYGGTFQTGSGQYSANRPDFFLEQEIVFVSFNYRLGVLGFLSTGDEACPGNWGIKDQILALKWVQDNIAYFGGNPENVTIFGESAGSVSVHLLLQTNQTEGLFQQAIMCSGSSLNLWALNTRATSIAKLTALNLLIISTNTTEIVEQLRNVEVDRLMRVGWLTGWGIFLTNGLRGLPFSPSLEPDVEGAVYINPSDEALISGNYNSVPVLMGYNSQEAVAAESIPAYLDLYLEYYNVASSNLVPWSLTQDTTQRFLAGENVKYHYFKLTDIATNRQQLTNFLSADQFHRAIRKSATAMANYATIYFYEFGYQGNVSTDGNRIYEGTGHAEDVAYYFVSGGNYTETDLKVSETIVLLWTNFVKFGNPTPDEDERLNNTIWSPIDPLVSDVAYLSINESIVMQVNPKQSDWDYYETLWDRFGSSALLTTY